MTKRAVRTSSTRRPAPKKRQPQRRKQRPGLFAQAVAALPFSPQTLQRITSWGIVGLVVAGALGVAAWAGLLSMAGTAVAEQVGAAGLQVREIQITGLKRMDRMTVYAQALDQKSRAMPLVDLAEVRRRLLNYPWIADARVSRRLPDTLMIHIVEREPAAVWQDNGQLALIDAHGIKLDAVSREAMPDLPLIVGDGANTQEEARARLMDAAPALKPLVRAATWVGNRRWDISFDTGERLQLPEGEAAATEALIKFAEMDSAQRVLGKGAIRFDMRVPGRVVVQTPQRSAAIAAPSSGLGPAAAEASPTAAADKTGSGKTDSDDQGQE